MDLALLFKQIALTTLIALVIGFLVFRGKDFPFRTKFKEVLIISFGICIRTLISFIILFLMMFLFMIILNEYG